MDEDFLKIRLLFRGLRGPGSANHFPPVTSLATKLKALIGNNRSGTYPANSEIVKLYATASVEMWQKALHSFLISASVTQASPVWASVSGYYASHYVMRAFAHLYGYFQVHSKRAIFELNLDNNNFSIHIINKKSDDGEHKLYWRLVHELPRFKNDPLFYPNIDSPPTTNSSADYRSDSGHRNRANYADHVCQFRTFRPLDDEALRTRIYKISSMEITDPQVPNVDNFPDLDNVQLIAYHRILKYRSFLDHILSSNNQFWTMQRNPTWKPQYFDFQIVGADTTELLADLIA
jgi:hypothetical protein